MEKILSIIIPTYNAEKFLDKGLPTFIMNDADKMNKLEVLVVNDGTPDNSVAIAQKYVDQYPDTFRIINKENGGHGSAINEGVKHATGKYFKCVDADDWVDTEALARLMDTLENEEECDALIQSFRNYDLITESYISRDIHCENTNKLYTLPEIMPMWDQIYHGMSFHGVTYNTSFYRKVNYSLTEGVFYEDQEYATIPMCYATKIRMSEDEVYVYRIGDVNQSIDATNQLKKSPHFEKVTFSMLELEKHLDELAPGGKELWAKKVSMFIGSYYQVALIKNPDKKSHRKAMKDFTRKIEEKSPYMYECVRNKYRVFVIFNHIHMNNDTFDKHFHPLLLRVKSMFHIHKLYS